MRDERTDALDIHLRAFTEPARDTEKPRGKRRRRSYPPGWMPPSGERDVLIFDCETTTGTQLPLTFGVWRLCREILDSNRRFVRLAVREEAIRHADEPPERDV